MTVNIYGTRTMMKAINLMKPTNTFLSDSFFGTSETTLTEKVEVDIKKGRRKMAPFVAPRVGGIVMVREGFETKTIGTPKIAPERLLTIDNITQRGLGENVYSNRTPEERAQELLANDLIELDDAITRRKEWMCRELLLTGKIDIIEETDNGKTIEKEVNFGFSNIKTLSGEDLWASTKSDPMEKLKEWRKEIIKKTGKNPDTLIMAADAMTAFLKHSKVKELFNILNMKYGTIEPSIQANGITFYGKIPELGVELYTYDEWFADENGDEHPMIPDGTVLMVSKDLGKTLYGAVTQMEKGEFITYEGERIPKVYADDKNETKNIRLTSRPMPVPNDVDSWVVGHVL